MSISIQKEDFNFGEEYQRLCAAAPTVGAVVAFSGLVRDFDGGRGQTLHLEHYPGMVEKSLEAIIDQAHIRWPITTARVVHRIGSLSPGEQIVFVGVSSAHREAAFRACEFIMDFLKTRAPFWKKAITAATEYWIDARETDSQSEQRWTE